MYSRGELFMRSGECYFNVYFPGCAAKKDINTKITLEQINSSPQEYIHYLILTRHNESINDAKNEDLHTSYPCRFTFCWWRHNRLAMTSQWPDNCDANTWQVISNSLDNDFIHGDIHDCSCKKNLFLGTLRCTWVLGYPLPVFQVVEIDL